MAIIRFRKQPEIGSINVDAISDIVLLASLNDVLYSGGANYLTHYSEPTGNIVTTSPNTESINGMIPLLNGSRLLVTTAISGLFTTDNDGVSWQLRTVTGTEAVATNGKGLVVAIETVGTRVLVSTDSGSTFVSHVLSALPVFQNRQTIKYYKELDRFYILGLTEILFSSDGINWTSISISFVGAQSQSVLNDQLYLGQVTTLGGESFIMPINGGTQVSLEKDLFYPMNLRYSGGATGPIFIETFNDTVYMVRVQAQIQALNSSIGIFEPIPNTIVTNSNSASNIVEFLGELWCAFGNQLSIIERV